MEPIPLDDFAFVDGHMHPPLAARPQTADEFAWPWYEGNHEYRELGLDLVTYRSALRDVAAIAGCEATEVAVMVEIETIGHAGWVLECIRAGKVEGLVVDTGFPGPDDCYPLDALTEAAAVPVAWLSRIESRAAGLVADASSLGEFRDRLRAALTEDLDAGAAGLKSIIAYRSGLAVGPVDEAAASAALGRLRVAAEAGAPVRLEEAAICDLVLADAYGVARERGVPMQLHSGYGDRDIDLRLGNPLHFRYALESGLAAGVPTVFLHCAYPYTREAAVLCANHRDVYLDIATCIPPIGTAEIIAAYRIALAICPITRIQSSSDAAGVIEQVPVAAVRARRALGYALAECYRLGDLTADEVDETADLVLAGNARRLYFAA